MSVRVLCIDDDRRLQELLVSWLGQNGVQVTPAFDGPTGIQALDASAFDAAALEEAFARAEARLATVRETLRGQAARVHEALDTRQRAELADLLASGWRRRWNG